MYFSAIKLQRWFTFYDSVSLPSIHLCFDLGDANCVCVLLNSPSPSCCVGPLVFESPLHYLQQLNNAFISVGPIIRQNHGA